MQWTNGLVLALVSRDSRGQLRVARGEGAYRTIYNELSALVSSIRGFLIASRRYRTPTSLTLRRWNVMVYGTAGHEHIQVLILYDRPPRSQLTVDEVCRSCEP